MENFQLLPLQTYFMKLQKQVATRYAAFVLWTTAPSYFRAFNYKNSEREICSKLFIRLGRNTLIDFIWFVNFVFNWRKVHVHVDVMEIREFKIPAPWGHIAIKVWGDYRNQPIICLHGLHDNAGTFDALIPLLPQNFYYICVDLPGHGLSDHFPSSLPLEFTTYLFAVSVVIEHFNRQKYIVMGHSFGGRLLTLFTQIYPESVLKIITLDSGYILPITPKEYVYSLKEGYQTVKKIRSFESEECPSYSYDAIVDKVANGRVAGVLTNETAEHIAKRMIRKIGDDKYQFTIDRRLRSIIYPCFTEQYVDKIFEKFPIRCPALAIFASEILQMFEEYEKIHKFSQLPNIEFHEFDGHHHSHQTNPELIAPILNKFLLKPISKL
ncbi:hypothetical protein Trydic_g22413 [Trypoxylus dichotomus]